MLGSKALSGSLFYGGIRVRRKIGLTMLVGAAVGAVVGYIYGNVTVGIVWGVLFGAVWGAILDRRVQGRPPVG